ncbi:hypothetical protein [Altererythrobacter lutimaris]|uniref:Uncharacterized protein n=1 Tax=Altererythrobacter lutimaris TaxID=2743979 RepID=A0A850HIE3_9SPHN|nr:hypothetical protein [Altererythrobacter lutimaris]NVE95302.1 hypothetical protein [Altererythrobacter lutimaris]
MSALERRIAEQLAAPIDPQVIDFGRALANEVGAIAVLFYGSNLRTGSLDGVLDFYLLLPGRQQERIWPRVSYHEREGEGGITLRAKVATMSLERFYAASAGERLDTTIWARFVQPAGLVWFLDDAVKRQVVDAISAAAQTAARLAAALGPEEGRAEDYWRALFRATYSAEFRVEKAGRENDILSVNEAHFDGLLPLAWDAAGVTFERDGATLAPEMSRDDREMVLRWWKTRRRMGKTLNITRLIKASTTFEGAGRYAAWKIERHTGIPVKVTPFREKHPILAAPGVLFKIWREKRKRGE